MLTVNKLIAQGRGLAPALLKRAATVELAWDTRQKSRFDATDSAGRALAVFLPRGTAVRGGDALVVEDGSLVIVQAAAQPVMVVRTCAEHGTPADLLRAAYHLGNRHVPVDLRTDRLQFEPDHVLAAMLRRMHLIVTDEQAAFEPEGGAYQGDGHGEAHAHTHGHEHHEHGHDQGHAHDHGHDHADDHAHGHAPATAPNPAPNPAISPTPAAHVHGPGCGHDHAHQLGPKHGH